MPSPGALELQQDAVVPGEPKTILGDRGGQEGAAARLEPRTIFCWDEQVRVEIEALKMGPTGTGRRDPRVISPGRSAQTAWFSAREHASHAIDRMSVSPREPPP